MFDQVLQDMRATVFVEQGIYSTVTASNVGVSSEVIFEGAHEYDFSAAVAAIHSLNKAANNCPKYLTKRINALRNQFIFAFGPDMERAIA